MGFTTEEGMVRVDFFKESGKWYTTEAIDMLPFYHDLDGFRKAVYKHLEDGRLRGMWAVCLEPYLEHKFPRMLKVE